MAMTIAAASAGRAAVMAMTAAPVTAVATVVVMASNQGGIAEAQPCARKATTIMPAPDCADRSATERRISYDWLRLGPLAPMLGGPFMLRR